MAATRSRAAKAHNISYKESGYEDSDADGVGMGIAGPSRTPARKRKAVTSDDEKPPAAKRRRKTLEKKNGTPVRNRARRKSVNGETLGDSDDGDDGSDEGEIETTLRNAASGVSALRRQISSLKATNASLQSEVENLRDTQEAETQPKKGRRGGMSVQGMQAQLRKLNNQIAQLEKARQKDKKKIQKLKMKEIEHDAEELEDEMTNGIGDTTDKMRKLLRRFYKLVSTASLEEEEECSICMEKMELGKAESLPCQHIFCKTCLSQLERQICPSCREPFELGDVERVSHTATQQWDSLLEVAQDWARLDKHGADSEPEETEEEELPFIDDDDPDASSALSEPGTANDEQGDPQSHDLPDPEPDQPPTDADMGAATNGRSTRNRALSSDAEQDDDADVGSPPATPSKASDRPLSYHESPTPDKRKRLQALLERKQKKLR